ncbi:MAG: tryptophan synthase subunit beta [Silvanigrellales bacterium]|jgi:tryptophan synthase beta chain|nr:tryptophan synthase subunit beta [Silvanigrellales bacterium]
MTTQAPYAQRMELSQAFAPPLLKPALERLEKGFAAYRADAGQTAEFADLLRTFAGRPTPVTEATNLSRKWKGRVFLKREDLVHGGAHKLNNALGQCHLARFMGFSEVIAETGAGQHGVATAMAAAKLGLKARVFQGKKDVDRQRPNALRMRLFGAELIPVTDGQATLKEAVNAAMREWVATFRTTAYCLGSIVGPHPYPGLVRHFQSVIGQEAREEMLKRLGGKHPDAVFACVGGGSNAAGVFSGYVEDASVRLVGCEAAGAASLTHGTLGILHGMETLLLQTEERQIADTHSISAGLDYPGVGPWLAGLKLDGRLESAAIDDDASLAALVELARDEGVLCALESAHAVAGAKFFLQKNPGATVLVNISGRGDKDLDILLQKGLGT